MWYNRTQLYTDNEREQTLYQDTQLNRSSLQRHITENISYCQPTREKPSHSINDTECTSASKGMSTDNITGVQTRTMTEAQCAEAEANWELTNNPEQEQGAPNPAMNPTVDLHRTKEEAIKEFVW